MTREKSIKEVEFLRDAFLDRAEQCEKIGDLIPMDIYARTAENLNGVLKLLRPITREQVEKMRGKWIDARYSSKDVPQCQCSICGKKYIGLETDFCQYCGAPMTDKAVDILWKRLEEALKDGN